MPNALTGNVGLKIAPILVGTLVKHYFEQLVGDDDAVGGKSTKLRQDELLYDEAFNIVKAFLEASTKHTVEELQSFSNIRTPSPPWVHVVKLCVPMSCCDDAATYLIKALGGEEHTKKMVGGTKWWQVRGVKGIDAEWIAAKKDWDKAEKKRHEKSNMNESQRSSTSGPGVRPEASENYQPEMDEMRCILYAHGGGYYFGSVDQERYSIQRHARKINGRVFAINYRLAPQYPFPCAIQDLVAAYLYLIRPPEGAKHTPVHPSHIVVAGDSAGGGLCIALLQVLRDSGLPMPAGGVLISPWCDLTHSFPSIHINTATDVIPQYGLALYKPSTLWPPPPEEITHKVRESVRSRVRQAVGLSPKPSPADVHGTGNHDHLEVPHGEDHDIRIPQSGRTLHLGSTASLPDARPDPLDQSVTCETADGEKLTIDSQIQLYAPNYLLDHPLISSVRSYLGGLPPLLIIAGDKEVLRDEIIYFAHKAANPEKYPISEEARERYPPLQGIESRYGPTKVHLQVYDDAAHVLPVLFSFTTPAKYCYRAIASFIKLTTGMLPPTTAAEDIGPIPMTESPATTPSVSRPNTFFSRRGSSPTLPTSISAPKPEGHHRQHSSIFSFAHTKKDKDAGTGVAEEEQPRPSRLFFRRVVSYNASKHSNTNGASGEEGRKSSFFSRDRSRSKSLSRERSPPTREGSTDVAGPRFDKQESLSKREDVRTAGEVSVYANGLGSIIRERVSTRGVIRPLESESELSAFSLPPELVGVISELALRRYLDGQTKFEKKFNKAAKSIAKHRKQNLERAQKNAAKGMEQLQTFLAAVDKRRETGLEGVSSNGVKESLINNKSMPLAWALDADEHPPPSSIVSRRDTEEAIALAKIADQSVLMDEHSMSGNNLWSMIVNFLTVTPDNHHHSHSKPTTSGSEGETGEKSPRRGKRERIKAMFKEFLSEQKKADKASGVKKDDPGSETETSAEEAATNEHATRSASSGK